MNAPTAPPLPGPASGPAFGRPVLARHPFLAATLVAVLLAGALVGLLILNILQDREQALAAGRLRVQHLAQVWGEHAARSIEAVDLTLTTVAGEVERRIFNDRYSPHAFHQALAQKILYLPQVTGISVYDAEGRLENDGHDFPPRGDPVGTEAFFLKHRNAWVEFLIDRPRRQPHGRWTMRLSRRIADPEGGFGGVVLALVDPEFFHEFYRSRDTGDADAVALVDGAGTVQAYWSNAPVDATDLLGGPLASAPGFGRLPPDAVRRGGLTTYEDDHVLSAVYQLPDFPLRLAARQTKDKVLAGWRADAATTTAVVFGIAAGTIAFLAAAALLVRRRGAVERMLLLRHRAIEASSQGVVLVDAQRPDLPILYVNPAFTAITGYAPEEVLGRNARFLHGGDRDQPDLERIRAAIRDRIEVSATLRNYRKDGTPFWSELLISPVRDAAGRATHFVGLQRDVTERRRTLEELAATQARLVHLLASSPTIIYACRPSGDYGATFMSDNVQAVLGYPPEAFLEDSGFWSRHIHPDDAPEVFAQLPRLFEHGHHAHEYRFRHADGRYVHMRDTLRLITDADGRPAELVGAWFDITERKQAEVRMAEVSAELARSNAELEQFSYVVSHDLQEPLRMVASYLQLLSRRYDDRLDPEGREFIGYAIDGARRMSTMIRDLLEYSRINRRGGALEDTDLDQTCRSALANLQAVVAESGAEVTLAALPTVRGDPGQLLRLMQNLIGNALKYRAKDRPPRVAVEGRREDGQWLISVADNGIGIAPEHFERIFQMFQRLHGRGDYEGTGIGLAICRKIVERHGGRLWVESTPGRGSTFRFTLPDSPPPAAEPR